MITTVFLVVISILGAVKDVDRFQMPDWNTCVAVAETARIETPITITKTEPDGTVTVTTQSTGTYIIFCAERDRKCKKNEVCP